MEPLNAARSQEAIPLPENQEPSTHFGFLTVPEDDKVRWVRRHFNTVACKYDFMNTLLSFGAHYIWKRIAVRMMDLREGDRIIDVCGGTADLALMAAPQIGRASCRERV